MSIQSDFARIAAHIAVIPAQAPPCETTSTGSTAVPKQVTSPAAMTPEQVFARVREPMMPIQMLDNSQIVLKCPKGHIHKYFISDVVKTTVGCITCKDKNSAQISIIESLLGIVICVRDGHYINPLVKLRISVGKPVASREVDGWVELDIPRSKSEAKIKLWLGTLAKYSDKFPQTMREKFVQKEEKKYVKPAMPYAPEHASFRNNAGIPGVDIIDDEKMYIENCTI